LSCPRAQGFGRDFQVTFLVSALEVLYYATMGIVIIAYTVGLAMLFRSSSKPPVRTMSEFAPTVSLVIPTYNEASVIRQKLENVLDLEYPREKLEVVVVDSASTDETGSIVSKFAGEHRREINLVLIEQAVRRGKSEAINEALRSVRSEIIVLTDADVTFPPRSVRKLVENFGGSEVGAVSGVEVPVGGKSFLTGIEADYRRIYTAIRMAEAETDTPFMCESELSAYRRDLLEPLRPGVVCDDVELTVMVRAKGFKALYAPDVSFLETEAGKLRPKLQHKLRRGMNNQHALLQNSKVLFSRDLGKYGTIVFPFEFFVHIVSPVLLTLSLVLFLALAVFSPSSALIALLATVILSIPALGILRSLITRYRGTEVAGLHGTGSWVFGAFAFLAFQLVLFVGLLKLGFKGPQTNWQQVPGTRIPITVEASG
jgi:cellulose synthase/poly-beta-1,6-N-acetylglucosamine synthase-like glycosyltransferase